MMNLSPFNWKRYTVNILSFDKPVESKWEKDNDNTNIEGEKMSNPIVWKIFPMSKLNNYLLRNQVERN